MTKRKPAPDRIPLQTLFDGPRCHETLTGIAHAISQGVVFIYPTETIYGIGGIGTMTAVRDKIVAAKKRPLDNPMILIAAARSYFNPLSIEFPPEADTLAKRFWPGMLTLVLPSATDPRGIAVRVSPHPFIIALFRHIDTPLFSTSANVSGEAYVNDPDRIYSAFSGAIDFMIDAGPLPPSLPSTVVRVGNDHSVTVIREGAISEKSILEACQ